MLEKRLAEPTIILGREGGELSCLYFFQSITIILGPGAVPVPWQNSVKGELVLVEHACAYGKASRGIKMPAKEQSVPALLPDQNVTFSTQFSIFNV